jgi:hypothetical protein
MSSLQMVRISLCFDGAVPYASPVRIGELLEAIRISQVNYDTNHDGNDGQPDPQIPMKSVYRMIEKIATLVVCEIQCGFRESGVKILENLTETGGKITFSRLASDLNLFISPSENLKSKIASSLAVSIQTGLTEFETHPRLCAIDFARKLCKCKCVPS